MEKTLARPTTNQYSPPSSAGFKRRTRRRRLSETTAVLAFRKIGEEEDDDGRGVEEKIVALQKIVPGAAALGTEALFEETAGYILALQCQIEAMKFLTAFLEPTLEKQNSKFGG